MVDTSDEWITTRTGIKERRILENGKGTSFMAANAAKMILDKKGMSPDDIELIVLATVTPDQPVPSAAAMVQDALGANHCWGFDLNGGCSGFICALSVASQFIETGKHEKVMVIGADKMSSIIDKEDRNTCVIFGDAAGAVLLEAAKDENTGIRDFSIRVDGSGAPFLCVKAGGSLLPASHETVEKKQHYVYQDGRAVFKRAVNSMAEISVEILKKNGLGEKDLGLFVPHQANSRIIQAVSEKMGLDEKKVMLNIGKYGNTTAATIPMAIYDAVKAGRIAKGDWLLMSAFGAGFTWGSLLMKWAMDTGNLKNHPLIS